MASRTFSSGWAHLDVALPGGGWPCGAITDVLAPQPGVLEWRLSGFALRQVVQQGGQVAVVGPPKHPHMPGLLHVGLDQRQLVWIQAQTPAERLWATEQLIRSNVGAILAWVAQARPEQIRRLQLHALHSACLVFLFRPEAARHTACAVPLRLLVRHGMDWALELDILKRRGPVHHETLRLPSIPGGLEQVLTPRLQRPSLLWQQTAAPAPFLVEAPHALGHPAARTPCRASACV